MANGAKLSCWMDRGLRAVVTVVFLWAGIAKAIDPAAFHREILNHRLGPTGLAVVVALYLPWLEILAAIGLWIDSVRRGATQLLLMLTVVFLGAIGAAWIRGLDIGCGCFGGAAEGGTNYPLLVGRDLALLLTLVMIIWIRRRLAGVGAG